MHTVSPLHPRTPNHKSETIQVLIEKNSCISGLRNSNPCCSRSNCILYLYQQPFLPCCFCLAFFLVFLLVSFFFLRSAVAGVLTQGSFLVLLQISISWGVCIGRIRVMNRKGRKEGKCVLESVLFTLHCTSLSPSWIHLPVVCYSPTISSPSL